MLCKFVVSGSIRLNVVDVCCPANVVADVLIMSVVARQRRGRWEQTRSRGFSRWRVWKLWGAASETNRADWVSSGCGHSCLRTWYVKQKLRWGMHPGVCHDSRVRWEGVEKAADGVTRCNIACCRETCYHLDLGHQDISRQAWVVSFWIKGIKTSSHARKVLVLVHGKEVCGHQSLVE